VRQFNCGGQATVGGVVPDMASITWDIIRRLKKNKVAAAAEPARACNLALCVLKTRFGNSSDEVRRGQVVM